MANTEADLGGHPIPSRRPHVALVCSGFAKVVADAKYGELLGAHLVGPDVSELLPEVTLAQKWDLTAGRHPALGFGHPLGDQIGHEDHCESAVPEGNDYPWDACLVRRSPPQLCGIASGCACRGGGGRSAWVCRPCWPPR